MKMKQSLCALLCAGMLLTLMPVTAWAADTACTYIDENGVTQNTTATIIEGSGAGETLTTGWYIVQDAGITRSSTVTVSGDVHLILADGASLEVTGETHNAGIRVTPGNTLTIYGQSLSTGALTVTGGPGDDSGAGIGGGYTKNGGTVTINGGTVNAQGGEGGAGIGGGQGGNGGTVTINGGTVNAQGGLNGAGIGGGNDGAGGTVTINGGMVNAQGSEGGAGIGGGCDGVGTSDTVTVNGGAVNATSGLGGAGIGGGAWGYCGTVTINGGTVNATGGSSGAGIGGGFIGAGGTVTISGGTIRAQGGDGAQDIGHGAGGTGGTLKNESGVDVFLTTITLEGVTTETQVNSLTTSVDYYGMHDVNTDASGKLYLYLPQGAVTIGAQTPSTQYTGMAVTADSPTAFTFTEPALAEREIELRTENGQIQWRYTDETEWHDLVALSEITGPQGDTGPAGADGADGSDGKDGSDGEKGRTGADGAVGADGSDGEKGRAGKDGKDGNGIEGITKTATEGHVDTYTIALTNGTQTSFTVTNGKDGTGIEGTAVNDNGEVVLTLTDGTQLKIDDNILPAGAAAPPVQSGGNATATVSLIIAIVALLSHLGWIIPLLLRKRSQ